MTENNRIDIYPKVYYEVNEIIKYMSDSIRDRIPNDIKNAINELMDKNYYFTYDETKPLYEQDILQETKAFISILYSEYLCSDEEKLKWNEYDKFERKKLERFKEMQNNEVDVFTKLNNKKDALEKENSEIYQIVEYKPNIFYKIFTFFKSLFHKKI